MSMVPWVSYRPGTWLIDECQIAFFMSCLMLRNLNPLFVVIFCCHLSYCQQQELRSKVIGLVVLKYLMRNKSRSFLGGQL